MIKFHYIVCLLHAKMLAMYTCPSTEGVNSYIFPYNNLFLLCTIVKNSIHIR